MTRTTYCNADDDGIWLFSIYMCMQVYYGDEAGNSEKLQATNKGEVIMLH